VFDTETIRIINLFESVTGAAVRDCIVEDDTVYYIVEEGQIGIAIGKNGINIKTAERMLGKKIKVFEYRSDVEEFLRRAIPLIKDFQLVNDNDGKRIAVIRVSKKDRPIVIGRNGRNIKIYKKILERNYKIADLKVK